MEQNQVADQAPMQSAPVVPKDSIVQDDNAKKGGKGAIIGMVIFAILALGGIGFGVWAWMDGNTQKDALNNQISDLKKQNGELLDKMAEAGGNSDVNTEDYIYVGEWGIKIKIPEGLNMISYAFNQESGYGTAYIDSVSVMGTVGSGLSDFANPFKNTSSLGVVSRVAKGAFDGSEYDDDFMDNPRDCGLGSSLVFSDDSYNYCYSHPHDVMSTDETEKELEVESVEMIQGMLTNAENYSKI